MSTYKSCCRSCRVSVSPQDGLCEQGQSAAATGHVHQLALTAGRLGRHGRELSRAPADLRALTPPALIADRSSWVARPAAGGGLSDQQNGAAQEAGQHHPGVCHRHWRHSDFPLRHHVRITGCSVRGVYCTDSVQEGGFRPTKCKVSSELSGQTSNVKAVSCRRWQKFRAARRAAVLQVL